MNRRDGSYHHHHHNCTQPLAIGHWLVRVLFVTTSPLYDFQDHTNHILSVSIYGPGKLSPSSVYCILAE